MNLSKCKRVILFNLVDDENDRDSKVIEFRHYGISAR